MLKAINAVPAMWRSLAAATTRHHFAPSTANKWRCALHKAPNPNPRTVSASPARSGASDRATAISKRSRSLALGALLRMFAWEIPSRR